MFSPLLIISVVAVSQGLANAIRKISSTTQHRATTITTTTMLVNSIFAIPLLFYRFRLPTHAFTWFLVACSVLIFAFSAALMYKSYQHIELSLMTILQRLGIIFVAVLGSIMLGERLSLTDVGGISLLFIASITVLYERKKLAFTPGSWYIIMSAFLGAVAGVLDKQILTDFSPFTYSFINNFLVGIVFLARKNTIKESVHFLRKFPSQILSSSFFGIVGFTGLLVVLSNTPVSLTMPVYKTLSFFVTVLLGIIWFKETGKLWQKALGGMLATLGIILLYI